MAGARTRSPASVSASAATGPTSGQVAVLALRFFNAAARPRGECCLRPCHPLPWRLTVRPSRRRFAARLNSGVRAHMRLLALPMLALAAACSAPSGGPAQVATSAPDAAAKLNAQAKTQCGVDIRSLALLFEADSGNYLNKGAFMGRESWFSLQNLESQGLVKARTLRGLPDGRESDTEFIVVELTSKGRQVRDALDAP